MGLGSISWCLHTPQGVSQGPPTAAAQQLLGDKGDVLHGSMWQSPCAAHTSPTWDPGNCVTRLRGTRQGWGVLAQGLRLSLGTQDTQGDRRVAQRLLLQWHGDRGRAQVRVLWGHLPGSGWLSTVGKCFGAGTSKSSPAVSGDPKGTTAMGIAFVRCRSHTSCQLVHSSTHRVVPALGVHAHC